MKTAFLGWGSLIWNRWSLRIRGEWKEEGPSIPIEFGRISKDGRLTLVICPDCPEVAETETLWAYSDHGDLKEAMENLRDREGTSPKRIGCVLVNSLPEGYVEGIRDWADKRQLDATAWRKVFIRIQQDSKNSNLLAEEHVENIRKWAREEGIDAVLWTDLQSNWSDPPNELADMVKGHFSAEEVIAYLKRLSGRSSRKSCEAERYIRFAPEQVRTPIRHAIQEEFGWVFVPKKRRLDFGPRGITSTSAGLPRSPLLPLAHHLPEPLQELLHLVSSLLGGRKV